MYYHCGHNRHTTIHSKMHYKKFIRLYQSILQHPFRQLLLDHPSFIFTLQAHQCCAWRDVLKNPTTVEFCGVVLSPTTIFKTVSKQVLILWPVFVLHHRCQRRLLPPTTPPFSFINSGHIQSPVVVNFGDLSINQPDHYNRLLKTGLPQRDHCRKWSYVCIVS